MLIRFAILAPLSMLFPKLRAVVVGRYSGLQINPKFVRPKPEGEFARDWAWQEAACSVWAIALLAMVATGVVPLREFLIFLAVASGVMFLNQVRTLVAHLWENDGEPMSVTAQFLDSVNVPPPATLPMFWAPVGLRYHALHHLLPGLALSRARRGAPAAVQGAGIGFGLPRLQPPRTDALGAPPRREHDESPRRSLSYLFSITLSCLSSGPARIAQ